MLAIAALVHDRAWILPYWLQAIRYLCCRGHTHPPVSIETLSVFPSKNSDGREVNDE